MTTASSNVNEITQSEGTNFKKTMDNGNVGSLTTVFYWIMFFRDPITRTAVYMREMYLFVLISIGVPCNILSFLVLQRIKPVTSAIFVMMILAVVDSLTLCVECISKATLIALVSYTNAGCLLMMTIRNLLQYYPIWLVVLLTLERVVAVCFPMKAKTICTLSNARRSLILLFIFDCLLCIGSTFLYEERYIGRYACLVKPKYERFYTSIWMVCDAMFFVMIPLTLLFLGNIAIIIKLRMSQEIYSSSDDTSTLERTRQNRSVTVMLLVVCITTLVCLIPNAVYSSELVDLVVIPGEDIRTAALKELAISMIFLFTYITNAANFFLYVLSGRRFRGVFQEMLSDWFGILKTHERCT